MSSEWVKTTVGDFCSFKYGKGLPERDRQAGSIPVISSAGVIGSHNAAFVQSAGVVIGRKGTVGSVTFSEIPFWPIDTAFFVDDLPNTRDIRFTYYLLKTLGFHQMNTDSAVPGLNRDNAHSLEVLVPPVEEQREIAKTLKKLDDRITLLRETNVTLEAIAQALFKSWFVDFDPVRAKQECRAPEGMNDATAALFPDSFEESELGLVPRGWHFSTVGDSFILTMGQSPPGDTYNNVGEGLPFYQGRTDFGFRFPTQRIFCAAPTRYAEIGDTLVSVRAPVGDVNMAIEKCCIGRGVAGVRHPEGYRSFAFYAIRRLRERFDMFDSEGTVFGSINKKDFQELEVILPAQKVLALYDDVASPIDQQIIQNEEKLRTLSNLRDTLLPRLISGQLRLPEAEELVNA